MPWRETYPPSRETPVFFALKGNAISASQGCFKVEVLIAQSCLTLCNPMDLQETVARQSPLSMRFSRQEYWRELLCLPSGNFPDTGIKPVSPALTGEFFTASATWETLIL